MKNNPDSPPKKIRVLIVDDHPVVRQGMVQLISGEPDLIVCAEAESAEKALEAISSSQPDVVIVDVSLKGSNGIELTKKIKQQDPNLPVLVLSMHDDSLYADRVLQTGASGYVMKNEATEKLVNAIRRVMKGETIGGSG